MTKSRPRTIQIYLPSGDPRGVRVAELTTSIVRVIEVPRALLDEFLAMPEAKQVGLYFLIGDDEDQDFPAAYIGQSGNVGGRIAEHHKQKEFWNRALVVVSLTNSLTQTHALFLEWCAIKHANEAGRYNVQNGNGGSKPHTPAPLEADCWEIFDTLRTLITTLGQPVLEPLVKSKDQAKSDDYFYCKSSSYDAVGQYTEEGLVVLKGSEARNKLTPGMVSTSLGKRRQALIDEGGMKLDGDVYVFQRDVLFKSPSGASDIVAGASTNGWILWKTKDGKTLDELKRQPSQASVNSTELDSRAL